MFLSCAAYPAVSERKFSWKNFLSACTVHGFILFAFGAAGIQRAEYKMAAGESAVEVQLVAPPTQAPVAPATAVQMPEPLPVEEKKEEFVIPKKEEPKPKPIRKIVKVVKKIEATPPAAPQPEQAVNASLNTAPATGDAPQGGRQGAGIDLQAAYLRNPPPPYPRESRRLQEEGTVLLVVAIDSRGEVTDLSVKASSGFDRLDHAAANAVRRWVFKPTRIAGLASEDVVEVPIRFTLRKTRHDT